MVRLNRIRALGAAVAALAGAAQARAESPVQLDAVYTADVSTTLSGGADERLRYLDNLDLTAEADLEALLGWKGARAQVYVLGNFGARPNDSVGSLQGVDNIEVGKSSVRLFEAWVEQGFGEGHSLRAGLYDLNSEFYANESAGLLIAPPFGIGSELAATGPNGPSIFPSSALATRLELGFGAAADGKRPGKLRLAAVNARASTLGDTGGVDFSFREGLLLIGEAEWRLGPARLVGAGWTYTERRDDIFETDSSGAPLRHRSWGLFGSVEARLGEWQGCGVDAFLRGGFSEGHTTPYDWGVQTGVLVSPAFTSRPDSAFSLGVHHAATNRDFRDSLRAGGIIPARGETALELTYSDRIAPFLTVQPDVQLIARPGGIGNAPLAVVTTLRLTFAIPRAED